MILKGDSGYLQIDVLARKSSGLNDFWEDNWLFTSVVGRFPGFTVDYNCYLRADELKRCLDDMEMLIESNVSVVQLTTLEEGIEVSFQKMQEGKMLVSGKLVATELTKCQLMFSFETDMYTITDFYAQIERTVTDFPVAGTR